jgi:hypothetical protein
MNSPDRKQACQQKGPYDHKFVLDRIKRLLVARAQQGGSSGSYASLPLGLVTRL